MPVSGHSGAQDVEVDPVRQDAYLKGLAAGRSERAAEVERLLLLLDRAWRVIGNIDLADDIEEVLRRHAG